MESKGCRAPLNQTRPWSQVRCRRCMTYYHRPLHPHAGPSTGRAIRDTKINENPPHSQNISTLSRKWLTWLLPAESHCPCRPGLTPRPFQNPRQLEKAQWGN